VGHGGEESQVEKCIGIVLDAQEIVKGQIWRITFHSSSGTRFFHVIEATCEVVGEATQGSQFTGTESPSINLRADWSAYIANFLENTSVRSRPDAIQSPSNLLDHLQWTNHEEYTQGISQLWLTRVKNEGNLGIAKLTCAQRYVLACVVGNRHFSPCFHRVHSDAILTASAGPGCPLTVCFKNSMAYLMACSLQRSTSITESICFYLRKR
jgi:hypothetical protein